MLSNLEKSQLDGQEHPYVPGFDMDFQRWWNKTGEDDPDSHFTFGEIVWKAARKDLLREQRKRRVRKNRDA